jgi:hypothetical protein
MDAIELCLHRGPQSAAGLRQQLGLSQPTLSRRLAGLPQVLVMGRARATRYGLRRTLRDLPLALPLYRVDAAGDAHELGLLHAVHGGWWFADRQRPRDSAWFDGLPWFLADMRPQGFLGAGFARRYPDLGMPERVADWHDDHAVYALARRGEDAAGNLILGEEAFGRWASTALPVIAQPAAAYPQLAAAALAGEHGGSSAGGEQPKFTALIDDGGGARHMLVKFSEPLTLAAGQRWADLLVAEHLALQRIRAAGLAAAESRLLSAQGRMFLEVARFDRCGLRGRRGLISLAAIDDQFVGERRHWLASAQALAAQGRMLADDVERVAWLQAFGEMIGNTDMHFGNLSLHYEGRWPAALAPAYDMLPMLYAPRRAEVLTPVLRPRPPAAGGLQAARHARSVALAFWQAVADDPRVSADFRAVAERNTGVIEALRW